MSDSFQPLGLQHARLSCPSLSPRACSKSFPLCWWCCLTISTSTSPFFFCLQSFPATGSFPVSRLFASGGQSVEVSASASALSMDIQGWFHLGLTGLIFLVSPNDNSAKVEKMTWGELNLSHIYKGLPTAKAPEGDSGMSEPRSLLPHFSQESSGLGLRR